MRLRDFLIPLLAGAACLAAGWYLGAAGESDAQTAGVKETRDRRATSAPVASTLTDYQDCPQFVPKDETVRATVASQRMPTKEQAAASMQAHAVLDAAISRRVWTDEDAEAFTGYFDDLSAEEKVATLRKFTMAINQQLVKADTERMPF